MSFIQENLNCSGCHACYNACPKHCITMKSDNEGFWYPQMEQANCINCGLCERVCPILHKITVNRAPQAYAAYLGDEKTRMESSSGGIFTALAEDVSKQGGVVFGACFDKNFDVVHDYAETIQELEKFRGSKYVQSKIGDTYRQAKDFLETGRPVLFSGTPCQIGGLKSYLGKEYNNLICQDLICHGVPSPKVWQKYVAFREAEAGVPARRIAFRSKDEGWKRYSVSFEFKNDTEYRETLDRDLYMRAFLHNVCLRPSCYHCAFKTLHRQSDITLADFWGIERIVPEMFDDKGTSLVLVNTPKGQTLFERIAAKAVVKKVDWQQISGLNPAAYQSAIPSPYRQAFFEKLDDQGFEELIKKYGIDPISTRIRRKIINRIKKALKAVGLFDTVNKLRDRRD